MLIALFKNTRAVIKAEQACRRADIAVRVMPVPETVSSECGMCLEIREDDAPVFEGLMHNTDIDFMLKIISVPLKWDWLKVK